MNTNELARKLLQNSDMILSILLLIAAAIIAVIAVSPVNKWLKAIVLAYVILP